MSGQAGALSQGEIEKAVSAVESLLLLDEAEGSKLVYELAVDVVAAVFEQCGCHASVVRLRDLTESCDAHAKFD